MKKQVLFTVLVLQMIVGVTFAWGETRISSMPYTINSSGSYYLSQNWTTNSNGIIINADNVTIDFRGFTISGNIENEDSNGISTTQSKIRNIEIRGGSIRQFYTAIALSDLADAARLIDMRIVDNNMSAWLWGEGNMIKNCTFDNNNKGVHLAAGGVFTGNTVSNTKQGQGFGGDFGMTISGNSVYNNAGDGIYAGLGSTIIGNAVYGNQNAGIVVESAGTIKNNTVYQNGYDGIQLQDGNSLVDGNTAFGNNTSNQGFQNITTCATCTFGTNHAP